MGLSVSAIRRQFPILKEQIDGHPLVYLDNAATAQKPLAMIEAMTRFYEHDNANPHRGMHPLAERATVAYESARAAVATFLHAQHTEDIVFTKGTTEGINLVANGIGKSMKKGDRIVVSPLEHHSNIVPWLQLKEEKSIEVEWMDIDEEGHLDLGSLDRILERGRVKLVAVTALSNVLGIRPPLEEVITRAHAAGALTLVDAAQAVAHHPIDVTALGCDFLVFSGHKLYGPTGIGILYGKTDLLSSFPVYRGGGMMIKEVFQEHFTPADVPARFEAGTQPVAEAVGLHAAIDWLGQFSWPDVEAHEQSLLKKAMEDLSAIDGMTIVGPRNIEERSGSVSFAIQGIHPHDLTEILGRQGICLRAGHHCTQPLHRCLDLVATTRLSVGLYNTLEEIAVVAPAIREAQKLFA